MTAAVTVNTKNVVAATTTGRNGRIVFVSTVSVLMSRDAAPQEQSPGKGVISETKLLKSMIIRRRYNI